MSNTTDTTKTLCQCGRPKLPRHCPWCGRQDFYGVRKLMRLEVVDGVKILIKAWRCRVCQENFDETTQCKAPQKQLSVKAQRAADAVVSATLGWTEEERMDTLQNLFGKKKASK